MIKIPQRSNHGNPSATFQCPVGELDIKSATLQYPVGCNSQITPVLPSNIRQTALVNKSATLQYPVGCNSQITLALPSNIRQGAPVNPAHSNKINPLDNPVAAVSQSKTVNRRIYHAVFRSRKSFLKPTYKPYLNSLIKRANRQNKISNLFS